MTAPVLLETLIEKALLDKIDAGTFYAVTYPSGTPTLGANTSPTSKGASPISSTFGPSRQRMKLEHERQEWLWVVEAQWTVRVALEKFEKDLLGSPIVVPRDLNNGVTQQAELRLIGARYGQPARDEELNSTRIFTYARGAIGTYALWTFSAALTPKPSF